MGPSFALMRNSRRTGASKGVCKLLAAGLGGRVASVAAEPLSGASESSNGFINERMDGWMDMRTSMSIRDSRMSIQDTHQRHRQGHMYMYAHIHAYMNVHPFMYPCTCACIYMCPCLRLSVSLSVM
jgi:hypothetical protein